MSLRGTRQQVEILAAGDGEARVTRQHVEVLALGLGGKARVTRQFVEVLQTLAYSGGCTDVLVLSDQASYVLTPSTNLASDTLVITDAATCTVAYARAATDTLSLNDAVVRVHEVSAFDLVALGDQAIADCVRVAYDTLVLTDIAIFEIIHSVVDTLSFGETAIVTAIKSRSASDTFSLQDEANLIREFDREAFELVSLSDVATAERIISVSDSLELSDQATAERIIRASDVVVLSDIASYVGVFGKVASDLLVISDSTTPGHTTSQTASDALSLSETGIGDCCRVAADTLVLIDTAAYVLVRLVVDTLTLSDTASALRVYQREAIDYVALTDEANLEREIDVTATDAISLTENAALTFEAVDTISLSDTAVAFACHAAYDTLILSDEASITRDRQSASDELVLTDTATIGVVRFVSARDWLTDLSDRAWPGFHRVTASDALQAVYISYDPVTFEEIITYVGLQDSAKVSVVYAAPKTAEDHLSFAERAVGIKIRADAIAVSAADSLSLMDEAHLCSMGETVDSLALTDAAEVVASKLLVDNLDLSDEASYNIVRNSLSASDSLELGEAVLWYNDRLDDYLCIYHPFVGESTGNNPDPPVGELEGPIPGITDPFKLVYPVVGPFSDTLVLRAPNLGNRDRLQMNRISRETRGGTLITFADPIWPKVETLVLDFSGLTWAEANGLYTFMNNHLGLEIGVLDWEHRFWSGVITDLSAPIVQDGPGCKYTMGFEFEGELATYTP